MPVVLALLNAALVGIWFAFLAPMTDELDFQNRAGQSNKASLRNQIDAAERTLEKMEETRDAYASLRARGFLDPQDRLGATKVLERLREAHGLTSIEYEIAPEKVFDDPATRKTGYAVVSTRITLTMRGLFDADLVEFTQAVVDQFPGQVRPLSFSLQKLVGPTEKTLNALREGQLVDFVGGQFEFEWNTLRPLVKKAEG